MHSGYKRKGKKRFALDTILNWAILNGVYCLVKCWLIKSHGFLKVMSDNSPTPFVPRPTPLRVAEAAGGGTGFLRDLAP